jgi:hypothetical protein
VNFSKSSLQLVFHGSLITAAVTVMLGSGGRTSNALIAHVPVHGKIFKSAALGLGNQKGGEDTCEHESRKDLHDMIEPWARVGGCGITANTEGCNGTLSNDRSDLSRAGGDSVGG